MRLKYLLVCLALTGCNDPGMTANAPEPSNDRMVVDHFRSLGASYEVRAVYDEQRGNVCYALMRDSTASVVAPAFSCVKESQGEPDCTPPQTDAAGTRWPGTCPSDHIPGGH